MEKYRFVGINYASGPNSEVANYVDWITIARNDRLRLLLLNGQVNRITNFNATTYIGTGAGNMPIISGYVGVELILRIWDATDREAKTPPPL